MTEVLYIQRLASWRAATIAGMPSQTAAELLRARLKTLMHKRDINQTELAELAGKSPSWISGFLRDETGIAFDALDDLARALRVEVPDLFEDRDQLRHGSSIEQLLKGAPDDPAARSEYQQEILVAYRRISAAILREAASGVTEADSAAESARSGVTRRDRKPRVGRPRKLSGKETK